MSIPSRKRSYDAVFLAEIPEDLTCTICHLVLRDPVQVVACGHRYCAMCFEDITVHNKQSNTELLCPVDRKPIDINKVFEDNGMARTVGNLKVKCGNHNEGCEWNGCLGDLGSHEVKCDWGVKYKSLVQHDELMEMKMMYKDVLQRVGKCEKDLLTKEKEIVHFKLNIKDMKEENEKNKTEITLLKWSTAKLLNDMESLQGRNEEITRMYITQIEELEKKNSAMEKDIKDCKTEFNSKIENNLTKEMPSSSTRSTRSTDALKLIINEQIDALKNYTNEQIGILEKKIDSNGTQQFLEKVSTDVENLQSEIKVVQMKAASHLDKSPNTQTGDIKDIKTQVKTLQNALFLFDSIKSQNVRFKWIFENYVYDTGKKAYSPVFYSQVSGYRFQLLARFLGKEKKSLAVYLHLHRGRNEHGLIANLPPFDNEYTLAVLGKLNKTSKVLRVNAESIKARRDKSFSIADNKDCAIVACGCANLVSYPYDDYIINDSLYITCTLHL